MEQSLPQYGQNPLYQVQSYGGWIQVEEIWAKESERANSPATLLQVHPPRVRRKEVRRNFEQWGREDVYKRRTPP